MKKTIIIAIFLSIIAVYGYYYITKTSRIEYIAPIVTVKSDTIDQAKAKIQEQINVLNKKDKKLSDKISVLEKQRERIREIKMSFSSALK